MKNPPLKRKSRINPISAKKRKQIPRESAVRQNVCHSQGGCWVSTGGIYGGVCIGDKCKGCNTKQKGQMLHEFAHEVNKSQGGATDTENCRYLCIKCHAGEHHIRVVDSQPQWSRKEG